MRHHKGHRSNNKDSSSKSRLDKDPLTEENLKSEAKFIGERVNNVIFSGGTCLIFGKFEQIGNKQCSTSNISTMYECAKKTYLSDR